MERYILHKGEDRCESWEGWEGGRGCPCSQKGEGLVSCGRAGGRGCHGSQKGEGLVSCGREGGVPVLRKVRVS